MGRVGETARKLLKAAGGVFEDGRFAVFMLAALVFWNGLMLALVAIPPERGPLSEFAGEFRKWCFRYDADSETIDWTFTIPFFSVPLVLGVATLVVYSRQIMGVVRRPHTLIACIGAAVVVVAAASAGLVWSSESLPVANRPFPAEKLRTAYEAPVFELVNQDSERITLQDFHGKVVIVTGIYTTCPDT